MRGHLVTGQLKHSDLARMYSGVKKGEYLCSRNNTETYRHAKLKLQHTTEGSQLFHVFAAVCDLT